jgi:hypothetical protein
MGGFNDHGYTPPPIRDEGGSMEDDPSPRGGEHSGEGDLAW